MTDGHSWGKDAGTISRGLFQFIIVTYIFHVDSLWKVQSSIHRQQRIPETQICYPMLLADLSSNRWVTDCSELPGWVERLPK